MGYDEHDKPCAARFTGADPDLVAKAAKLMDLEVREASSSEDLADVAKKLPVGRLYGNGRGFVPNVRQDLYSKVVGLIVGRPEAGPARDGPRGRLPVATGLPRTWDEIAAGHLVIAQETLEFGWWEAIVHRPQGRHVHAAVSRLPAHAQVRSPSQRHRVDEPGRPNRRDRARGPSRVGRLGPCRPQLNILPPKIRSFCHGTQDSAHRRAQRSNCGNISIGGLAVITPGVAALGQEAVARIVKTIEVYDDFCHANDPHEEHDFGAFDADGKQDLFQDRLFRPDPDGALARSVRPFGHQARDHDHAGRGILTIRQEMQCPLGTTIPRLLVATHPEGSDDKFACIPDAAPIHRACLRREEGGGNWYYSEQLDLEGWLCPALLLYLPEAPKRLYVHTKSRTAG